MRATNTLLSSATLLIISAVTSISAAATIAHYRYDHGYALNDLRTTPGAVFPVGVAAICRSGYAASVRNVTEAEKSRVYAEYGIVHHASGQYEVDHLISLELGGSNSLKNLWPEPDDHPRGYLNSKDKLENRLHSLVCSRAVSLALAQWLISTDWVVAYHRYLGSWPSGRVTTGPTRTLPTTTAPVTAGVVITSLTDGVAPGSTASLSARSPRATGACTLTVVLPSGRQSTAAGLGTATANAQGAVSWTWKIGSTTNPGTATATVVCGTERAQRSFTIP